MECEHRLEKSKMKSKVCCKACYMKQYNKQYRIDNLESIKKYLKQYRIDNAKSIKQYYIKNAEYLKQYNKQYNIKNVERRNQYQKQRLQSDPLFKMSHNIRKRLYEYSKLKGSSRTWDLLGCSPIELRDWLEGQFKDGMNWDNQGQWHIDHILPLCAAENEEDFKILAHYTNLQPLWAEDNLKKGGY